MKVGDFCKRQVVTVERDETILDAAKLMRWHSVGEVVAIDREGGRRSPLGVLTDREIVVEFLAQEIDVSKVSVGEVMDLDLQVVSEEEGLIELVASMRTRGVQRLPVVNARGDLVGILTLDDVMEVLEEQLASLVGLLGSERLPERDLRI